MLPGLSKKRSIIIVPGGLPHFANMIAWLNLQIHVLIRFGLLTGRSKLPLKITGSARYRERP